MSLFCKTTTTNTISFGEDLGVGWRFARSCILAGATLYTPFSFFLCCSPQVWDAVHRIDSCAAAATAVCLFVSDIPSLRIAFYVIGR